MAKKAAKTGKQTKYRVSGTQALYIDGARLEPGDEFQAELPPEYETQMLMGGHLEILEHGGALSAADAQTIDESKK